MTNLIYIVDVLAYMKAVGLGMDGVEIRKFKAMDVGEIIRGDYEDARRLLGGRIRRFDFELQLSEEEARRRGYSPGVRTFSTYHEDRVEFMKYLLLKGIKFVYRPATWGGHGRLYVRAEDYDRVVELFKEFFEI